MDEKKWDLLALRTDSMEELISHLKKHGAGTKFQRLWRIDEDVKMSKEVITLQRQITSIGEVSQEIAKLQQSNTYRKKLEKLRLKWMEFHPYVLPPVGTIQYSQLYALLEFEEKFST